MPQCKVPAWLAGETTAADHIKGSIAAKVDIDRILQALDIPIEPPTIGPARAPPQQDLEGPMAMAVPGAVRTPDSIGKT